jgi:hypothetical protein
VLDGRVEEVAQAHAVTLQLIAHCGLTATRMPEFGRQNHI